MHAGYLALLLHAHLPFVRHPEHEDFLEEDWLYEAVAETYIPLLKVFRQLAVERVNFRLSLTLTPTLCAMLRDPLLQQRCARYLQRGIELSAAELERVKNEGALRALAQFYHARFVEAAEFYEKEIARDVVGAFAQLQEDGYVEIITSAATHAFLPALEIFPEAIRAQVLIGRDHYRECFGRDPLGIWLPECGYVQGLDKILQEADLRWFVVDAHGLMYGQPRPRFAIYAPCFTPAGPAAFARDRESSKQVWSAEEGYPGDPAYRDFYRDIGQELPVDYLRRFLPGGEIRRNTGIKYHRITGKGAAKELYRRDWALGAADHHAGDFMRSRKAQIEHLHSMMGLEPIIVSPYDAELFGHWWFEGPEFLNWFIRKAVHDQDSFRLVTPSGYLKSHPVAQMVTPASSSWGHKGYAQVWLDPKNAWIYPHLHSATRQMIRAARQYAGECPAHADRLLAQMARELLLAQASDWAFLIKVGTAPAYAERRTKDHLLRFNRLYEELENTTKEPSILAICEERDNLFPKLNWRHYL